MMQQKKGLNAFWIFMLFYVFIGGLAICCGLIGFKDFIADYENSLPQHFMDKYVQSLSDGEYAVLFDEKAEIAPTEFENAEDIAGELFFDNKEALEFTYKKDMKNYSDEKPAFIVRADGKELARITLFSKEEKTRHNFPIWEIGRTDSFLKTAETHQIKITAPSSAFVKINGIEVGKSYISNEKAEIDELKSAYQYLPDAPYMTEYTVGGLYGEPQVTALGADGKEYVLLSPASGTYSFRLPYSEEKKAEQEEFVLGMERAYISYMINENKKKEENFARLAPYLMSGTPVYSWIRGVDVEWNILYDSREDVLIASDNYTDYGENCFSCNTEFNVLLKKYRHTSEFKGNIRWTFVKINGGWKAVQMKIEQDL